MSESIGALHAELSAGHAQFQSDMQKAKNAVASNAKGMVDAMNRVKGSFDSTMGAMSTIQTVARTMGAAVAGYLSVGFIKQLSEMGAKALQTETAFKNATDQLQIDAGKWVSVLKEATKGTIDESDLMQKAMKGITGGLSQEQITKIAELSTTSAIRMGVDVKEAYADIVDAVEIMRTKTLVKFGLITKAQAELAEEAKNAGEQVDIFRIIMENAANQKNLIGALDETALRFQQAKAAAQDFWESIGKEAAGAIGQVYEVGRVIKNLFSEEGRAANAKAAELKLNALAMNQSYMPGPHGMGSTSTPYTDSLKGAADRKKAADEARKHAETIKKVIENLKFEYEQLQRTDREQAIANALKSAGVSINSKYGQEIAALVGKNYDVAEAIKASRMESEEWLKQIEEIEKEKQALIDKLNDEIAALKLEAETFGMTAKEATLYKLALQGATQEQLKLAEAFLVTKERQEEIKRITEELKTPQEKYNEEVAKLKALLDSFGITWDQYTLGMQKAKETLDNATKGQKDELSELQKAIEDWGKQSADAIVEFAMTGKASFTDLANSIIKDILKMIVYQDMIQPLFKGLGGQSGGGGGLLGGLFKMFGSAGGGDAAFHKGGLIPRMHGGGLKPDEYRAVLQSGEYVVSRKGIDFLDKINSGRGESIGGGGATVNNVTINATDAQSFTNMLRANPNAIADAFMSAGRSNHPARRRS